MKDKKSKKDIDQLINERGKMIEDEIDSIKNLHDY
jgi:hypothetical protein